MFTPENDHFLSEIRIQDHLGRLFYSKREINISGNRSRKARPYPMCTIRDINANEFYNKTHKEF
jgi:hypothetical protein